jgi:cation transport regulator ChaB
MKQGLTATDAFLDAWHWSDEQEREGTAHEVAAALKAEFEAGKW